MKTTKVVIIGAGMAGLSAAIYLKRANVDFLVLEKEKIGGKLNILDRVENYPAAGLTTGLEIKEKLEQQITDLGIEVLNENVQSILIDPEGFKVVTNFDSIICKKVIIATGNGAKNSAIPGENAFFGRGVSYCAVCDGNFFKGANVAVIGNNNIALEEALYLSNLASKIYLVCPEKIEGDFELKNKVENNPKIEVSENSLVSEIKGSDFSVTSIVVNGKEIAVSGVFPYIGEKTATEILKGLNPIMKNNCAVVDENMESNIKGLYFAGDIVDKKLKQLITAVSDGAIAAVSASKGLN